MCIRKLLPKVAGLGAAAIVAYDSCPVASAQGGVELAPWAGIYVPTSNSFSTLTDDFSRDVSVIGGARSDVLGHRSPGIRGHRRVCAGESRWRDDQRDQHQPAPRQCQVLLALTPVTNRVGVYLGGGGAF